MCKCPKMEKSCLFKKKKKKKSIKQLIKSNELTAELVEVGLDLPPGVQEHAALLRAHRDHAVLVDGDARHLGVELGHGHALRSESHRLLVRTRPQSARSPGPGVPWEAPTYH